MTVASDLPADIGVDVETPVRTRATRRRRDAIDGYVHKFRLEGAEVEGGSSATDRPSSRIGAKLLIASGACILGFGTFLFIAAQLVAGR